MKILTSVILLLTFSEVSFGGSWSSSGGDLLRDTRNPWFVLHKNRKPISYCIQFNTAGISISEKTTQRLVHDAFEFWKVQFKYSFLSGPSNEPSMIPAVDHFYQEECNSKTDLVFQFGFLNQIQKSYLRNTGHHIGLTVRTEYDMKNLRGKGFIYIAPDRGKESFVEADSMVQEPWALADGHLLLLTLLHELGHVYGIPHDGGYWNLMSEKFVEMFLRKEIAQNIARLKLMPTFFKDAGKDNESVNTYCRNNPFVHPGTRALLGVPESFDCFQVETNFNEVIITGKEKITDLEWIPIGQSTFDKSEIAALAPVIHGYVDLHKQKIFSDQRPRTPHLWGMSKAVVRKLGNYKVANQKGSRTIFVEFLESSTRIGGALDGKFIPDLFPLPKDLLRKPEY